MSTRLYSDELYSELRELLGDTYEKYLQEYGEKLRKEANARKKDAAINIAKHGCSDEEIAEILNLNVETVKDWLKSIELETEKIKEEIRKRKNDIAVKLTEYGSSDEEIATVLDIDLETIKDWTKSVRSEIPT